MSALNVGPQRGEFVLKRVAHIALGSQVIALIGLDMLQ